jgi:hypothetical protein
MLRSKKAEPGTPHLFSLNQDIVVLSQEEKLRLKYVIFTLGGPVWTSDKTIKKERPPDCSGGRHIEAESHTHSPSYAAVRNSSSFLIATFHFSIQPNPVDVPTNNYNAINYHQNTSQLHSLL